MTQPSPATAMLTATVTGFGEGGPGQLASGVCSAWALPPDPTCARTARQVFREAARSLGMCDELIDDGVTMASELAANTLHAGAGSELAELRPAAGAPEMWLYVRRAQGQWELTCKLFDPLRGWRQGAPPEPGRSAPEDAVTGRGLQVIAALSGGRWGHHLTRSRLGGWKVAGKAVWFALPIPVPAHRAPDWVWRSRLTPRETARELAAMLADRGLGERLMVADEPAAGMAVLSVRCGLTIWCRDRSICWRSQVGRYQRQVVTDLVDLAEQIVCACEEMDHSAGAGYPGLDQVR